VSQFASEALIEAWQDCHGRTHSEVAVRLLQIARPDRDRRLARLTIGERDHALLELRAVITGDDLDLRATCPGCSEQLVLNASSDELVRAYAATDDGPHKLVVDPYVVWFRLPSSADLVAAMREPSTAARRAALWRRCVTCKRDGRECALVDIPVEIVEHVEAAMQDLDAQAVAEMELTCPICSHEWRVDFDIVPVLWAEVNGLVQRRLYDVHRLAAAYGWDEWHVLSMHPQRRQFYLDQLQS
jgi:hypothetical protein